MSRTSHDVLNFLATKGPSVALSIARELARAPLTVYRALRQLQGRGLVEKRETAQDGAGRAPCEWYVRREDKAA